MSQLMILPNYQIFWYFLQIQKYSSLYLIYLKDDLEDVEEDNEQQEEDALKTNPQEQTTDAR